VEISSLIADIVEQLKGVEGVRAIVLGGSRARGTHTAASDVDVGLYYHPDQPLDLGALERVVRTLDHRPEREPLTPIHGWGPWINGGGWLVVQGQAVDLLYRDLSQVAAVIGACHQGNIDVVYQPGHPYGFVSAIYMAEVALCRVLWAADDRLAQLKGQTIPYPPALKQGIIKTFAWEIDFSLAAARKGVGRNDGVYVAGACFRSAMCLLQVLFALNEVYWLNEKGAVALADRFKYRPEHLGARIEAAFHPLRAEANALEAAIAELESLYRETVQLIENQ
jgi:hypothetical protein